MGSENLLVIMWPESFGGFTFDLAPPPSSPIMLLDTNNTYNVYGTLKFVLEVCDVKTAYIKPHCMNSSVESRLTLDPTFKVLTLVNT